MKKIGHGSVIGQQGINLIERVCLQMGFVWYPTGGMEAGIDGYIEIRDGESGTVTNCIIQVQSKATEQPFSGETPASLELRCSERDIDYWLAGNAPVILVHSRPKTGEAYWVSLKDYFRDPKARKAKKIVFNRTTDRFGTEARSALQALAVPADSGLYLATRPTPERISTNLLCLGAFPPEYFVAQTEFRTKAEVFAAVRERGSRLSGEWILRDKMIYSFHDLHEPPWDTICDQGTVESLDTRGWAQTSDENQLRSFVQLLNACLKEHLYVKWVHFSRDHEYFYFKANPGQSERQYSYQSRENRTTRTVVKIYRAKKDHTRITYYRHGAFSGRFVRYGSDWYLQITPIYHFTRDGVNTSRFAPDYLSGIKRLENNQAVHGQVVMWASLLAERNLFDTKKPVLDFTTLAEFDLHVGVQDRAWIAREEPDNATQLQTDPDQLRLYERNIS